MVSSSSFSALQHLRHLAGHQVRVDVVGAAIVTHPDGGDDRDEIALDQHVDHRDIDALDLADMAEVDDLRLRELRGIPAQEQLAGVDQVAVLAGQARPRTRRGG